MIYVCLPSHDEADSLGLVLWKVRKIFDELRREYRVLVVDDASGDHTADVLEQYGTVLPLTVIRHAERQGYGRAVEALFRTALRMSDRPRRDSAVLLHADYVHRPEHLADVVRRLESGADLVIGQARVEGASRGYRWVRRFGAAWLRGATELNEVKDPISGFVGVRLATLRAAFSDSAPALRCDGWAANAELIAIAGAEARRVETFDMSERQDLRSRPSRIIPWAVARSLLRARTHVGRARARALEAAARGPARQEGGGPRPRRRRHGR